MNFILKKIIQKTKMLLKNTITVILRLCQNIL